MVLLDPAGHELAALLEHAPELEGGRVLEVGCGDGRLTWRYAARAGRVLAIDPDGGRIARARAQLTPALQSKVEFASISVEELGPDRGPYDVIVLSWSL